MILPSSVDVSVVDHPPPATKRFWREWGEGTVARDKSSIANLSATAIKAMTEEELARLILAAELPQRMYPDLERRLQWLERPTLQRLAFLARHCCQNENWGL
ncbi:MAG: hypothetical protein NT069_27685 [Planctomycetota bacterium]|nr:hypothetical protein [Planctomycetota bacterium]